MDRDDRPYKVVTFCCRFCAAKGEKRDEFLAYQIYSPNTGRVIPQECPRCGALCEQREKGNA